METLSSEDPRLMMREVSSLFIVGRDHHLKQQWVWCPDVLLSLDFLSTIGNPYNFFICLQIETHDLKTSQKTSTHWKNVLRITLQVCCTKIWFTDLQTHAQCSSNLFTCGFPHIKLELELKASLKANHGENCRALRCCCLQKYRIIVANIVRAWRHSCPQCHRRCRHTWCPAQSWCSTMGWSSESRRGSRPGHSCRSRCPSGTRRPPGECIHTINHQYV